MLGIDFPRGRLGERDMTGNIRERVKGSGRWTIQWYLGRDRLTGKKRFGCKTIKGKKEAQAELTRIIHEMDKKTYVEPSKMGMEEYLISWLRDYAITHVAGSTYERYSGIVHQHLIPAFAGLSIADLQPIHVQEYYAQAQKSGRVKQSLKRGQVKQRGLSSRSVQQHHAVLRKAIKCAVRLGLVGRNVCDMVDPPRVTYTERRVFTEEEIHLLLQHTDGMLHQKEREDQRPIPWGPIILLAASTGMRLGETLALTWSDFNPAAGAVSVEKSLEQTRSGVKPKAPKSDRGKRNIPIPENAVNRLLVYKEQLEAAGLVRISSPICPDEHGEYLKPDSVSSRFRDLVKKAGVSEIGFHSIRHAHATILANRGFGPKVIQERLGHSTIAITMDIYAHVLPTTQQDAADSIGDVF